ncbi:DNA internalization-related competence protein ComEC/Rec2 [Archangium violaceum]|uniref:Competence protein ComEC n=1 Tax=Archangium violaceum Cb vi76 TaxID=1406225 RepID=A0A084SNZ2_9BACT|nr:DNA internalization-related competence protein ComEC/Rec2 [Archangium violaceum]KFA90177.1 competence protein ComEC [Archangium violaceum Cb vi76]
MAAAFVGAASLALARLPGAHLGVLLCLGLTGAGLASLEAGVDVPPPLLQGGTAVLEGEVERVDRFEDSTRVLLAVARLGQGTGNPVRFHASLYAHGAAPSLLPGQRIRVEARLKPLESASNPGEKDFSATRRRQGLAFTGSFQGASLLVLSPPPRWRQHLVRTQEGLTAAVHAVAPSTEAAALFLTLAAGQRAALDDGLEEDFSRSGLAHVLSVSGLHVAALALMTLALLRKLLVRAGARVQGLRRVDARRLAAPASIPFVWAYVVFTGNQPPAVRSAVMATVVLLGLALWRRADGLNSLAAAAALLVAWTPSSVADLSLQLSFLAVFSLLLLTPALREALPVAPPNPQEQHRLERLLASTRETVLETFCASAAVTVASLPLVAGTFGRASLAGLVSNIVCMPLCGLLTGFAAGGAALYVVAPVLATPLLWGGAWASQVLLWLTRFFAHVPLATMDLPAFGTAASLLYAAGLACWALGERRARLGGLLLPVGLALVFVVPRLVPEPGLRITFLAVGQGDGIVLSSRGHHALIDGGGVPGGADPGLRVVVPFLRASRIERLDLAVLSHPHPDHALGLISALGQVPTERLWLSADSTDGHLSKQLIAAATGAHVEEVQLGHPSYRLGEATLEVLGPPEDRELMEGVNDKSVVLLVRHGDVTVLLPGDVEEEGEAALLASGKLGPVTVLKAAHHGSRTSSTEEFLTRLRPRFAVFCVGRRNRFGFPHPEVEARYRSLGTECLRTDVHGAITLESDGHDVRLSTFLPAEPPIPPSRVAHTAAHPQP